MIKANARLSIAVLPLEKIVVKEFQRRYPEKLSTYIQLLEEHPDEYAGLLSVEPFSGHDNLFILLDGHHRFAASIMTGRKDALCLIVEEPGQESEEETDATTDAEETQETARSGLTVVERGY